MQVYVRRRTQPSITNKSRGLTILSFPAAGLRRGVPGAIAACMFPCPASPRRLAAWGPALTDLAFNAGGHSGEAIPVPIPNTEVKLSNADDTGFPRESRQLPAFFFLNRMDWTALGLQEKKTDWCDWATRLQLCK